MKVYAVDGTTRLANVVSTIFEFKRVNKFVFHEGVKSVVPCLSMKRDSLYNFGDPEWSIAIAQQSDAKISEQENVNYMIVDLSGSMCSFKFSRISDFVKSIGKENSPWHIVTFSNESKYYYKETFKHDFCVGGMTDATGVPEKILDLELFEKKKHAKHCFYLFTDGRFNSQQASFQAFKRLETAYSGVDSWTVTFRIGNMAEVYGLVPFFAMDSSGSANIIDIDERSNDKIPFSAKETIVLESEDPIYKKMPWDAPVSKTSIQKGEFYFVKKAPNSELGLETFLSFYENVLLKLTLSSISKSSISDVQQKTLQWFTTVNEHLFCLATPGTYKPLQLLRQSRNKFTAITEKLKQLKNTEGVKRLDSQSQANYLRSISSDSRAGKRASKIDANSDIAQTVRKEFGNLKKYISEIDHVDDSEHERSFVSLETTCNSLRSIARDISDDEIERFSVEELLSLVNIVGLAVNSKVGDYPDPKLYWPTKVSFTFCSVSDVTAASPMTLSSPDKMEITNVIPYFQSTCLLRFCKRHLPSTLDLISGIGMRRQLMVVPKTFESSIAKGLLAITVQLRQEWSYKMIKNLFPQVNYLFRNSEKNCENIGQGVITVCDQIAQGNDLSKVYRDIFKREILVAVKRIVRHDEQNDRADLVKKCIQFDFEKTKNAFSLGTGFINSIVESREYVKGIVTIEKAMSCSCVTEFKEKLDALNFQDEFGIKCPVNVWMQYLTVQSFIQDTDTDILSEQDGIEMCKKYVDGLYSQYLIREKSRIVERELLHCVGEFSKKICDLEPSQFISEFENKHFKVHLSEYDETVEYKFASPDKYFNLLFDHVRDNCKYKMSEKIYYLIKPKDFFNNGNVLSFRFNKCKKILSKEHFDELLALVKETNTYTYRSGGNRHGHSNEFPSFFAMGFLGIEEFLLASTENEILEYKSAHTNCCFPFSKRPAK